MKPFSCHFSAPLLSNLPVGHAGVTELLQGQQRPQYRLSMAIDMPVPAPQGWKGWTFGLTMYTPHYTHHFIQSSQWSWKISTAMLILQVISHLHKVPRFIFPLQPFKEVKQDYGQENFRYHKAITRPSSLLARYFTSILVLAGYSWEHG